MISRWADAKRKKNNNEIRYNFSICCCREIGEFYLLFIRNDKFIEANKNSTLVKSPAYWFITACFSFMKMTMQKVMPRNNNNMKLRYHTSHSHTYVHEKIISEWK